MQVKVWNDNVHPYKEKFREQDIHIPPKQFIMMDKDEAHIFLGTFAGILRDADGNPIPEGYKMLRIEKVSEEKPVVTAHNCQACDYKAMSEKDLDEHITALHVEQMVDEEEVKKRKARKAG